jgi:hypothetical protein
MLVQVRPIAISIGVAFFFGIAIVSSVSGIAPYTCCKRALVGAFVGYMVANVALRIANAVLLRAIIENEVNKRTGSQG